MRNIQKIHEGYGTKEGENSKRADPIEQHDTFDDDDNDLQGRGSKDNGESSLYGNVVDGRVYSTTNCHQSKKIEQEILNGFFLRGSDQSSRSTSLLENNIVVGKVSTRNDFVDDTAARDRHILKSIDRDVWNNTFLNVNSSSFIPSPQQLAGPEVILSPLWPAVGAGIIGIVHRIVSVCLKQKSKPKIDQYMSVNDDNDGETVDEQFVDEYNDKYADDDHDDEDSCKSSKTRIDINNFIFLHVPSRETMSVAQGKMYSMIASRTVLKALLAVE